MYWPTLLKPCFHLYTYPVYSCSLYNVFIQNLAIHVVVRDEGIMQE